MYSLELKPIILALLQEHMLAVELKELKNKLKSKYNKNVEIQHRRYFDD